MPEHTTAEALATPSSSAAEKERLELRRDFVERRLGPASSHPSMAVRRIRAVKWLAFLGVGAVMAFAAWQIVGLWKGNSSNVVGVGLEIVGKALSQRKWWMAGLAGAVSMILTAGLTIRASFARGTSAPARSPGALATASVVGVALAIGLCCAMALLSGSPRIAAGTRWYFLVGSMLPVSVLLLWFNCFPRTVAGADHDADQAGGREAALVEGAQGALRMVRGVVGPAMVAASSLLLLPSVAGRASGFLFSLLAKVLGSFGVDWLAKLGEKLLQSVANGIGAVLFQFIAMGIVTSVAMMAISRVTAEVEAAASAYLPREEPADGGQDRPQQGGGIFGLFRRALGWVGGVAKSVFGGGGDEPAPPRGFKVTDAWIAELTERGRKVSGDPGMNVTWSPAQAKPGTGEPSSGLHEGAELNWLFGGNRPTQDQFAVLEAFDHRWCEHIRSVEQGDYFASRGSHADLFVESQEPRAGLTTALQACAVFAAITRGQRVLMLVSDRTTRDAHVAELRERLRSFRFDATYRVGTLDNASDWCPPASGIAARPVGEPPDIIVATPAEYDAVLLSGALDPVLVRAFMLSVEVVMVDGLQRLTRPKPWLWHLPFLIDKHRLLLRNENRAMQLVLGADPVTEAFASEAAVASVARERLAMRLFGGDGRVSGHFLPLRRRFCPRPASLEVACGGQSMKKAGAWLQSELLRVAPPEAIAVLVKPDEEADAAMGNGRRAAADGERDGDGGEVAEPPAPAPESVPSGDPVGPAPRPGRAVRGPRLRKVSLESIERNGGEALAGVEWIVVGRSTSVIDRRRLRMLLGIAADPTRPIIIELCVAEAALKGDQPQPSKPVLPVFVAADAPSLFLPHLRSAIPSLRTDATTRREDFARFGLSWDEQHWRAHAAAMRPARLHESWHLQVDGGLVEAMRVGEGSDAWPAVLVRREDAAPATPVEFDRPVDEGLCLVGADDRLDIATDPGFVDPRRFATWFNSRQLELGKTDLFLDGRLVLRTDRQEYRPMLLRPMPSGTMIEAEARATEGDDFVIPKVELSVRLPSDMAIDGPYQVRGARAWVFRVREGKTAIRSEESIYRLATEDGRESECNRVTFAVHVSVTLVALAADPPSDGGRIDEAVRAGYEGAWSTRRGERRGPRDPWPVLTGAVRRALDEVAPDLANFCRVFAFHPPFGSGGATLLFLEPPSTAGTSAEAVRTILDDSTLRSRFVAVLREAIGIVDGRAFAAGIPETDADVARSRREALALIDELERSGGWVPERRRSRDLTGRILAPDRGRTTDPVRLLPGATEVSIDPATLRWHDPFLTDVPGQPPQFGIPCTLTETDGRQATAGFGLPANLPPDDVDELRRRCLRLVGPATAWADYDQMMEASLAQLKPVAEAAMALAERCGLSSPRERLRLLAGLVQTTTYVVSRAGELEDGVERFGVQMPVETLTARKGDCDSVALLLVGLIRASGLAPAGIIVVETDTCGHAMAAVGIAAGPDDHVVRTAHGDLVIVECTALCPIGHCMAEVVGRHAQVVGFR